MTKETVITTQVILRDPSELLKCLDVDLLSAFSQCFIHADRLTSMIHFTILTNKHCPREPVVQERNIQTMFWIVCGTLWETKEAVENLSLAEIEKEIEKGNVSRDKWCELISLVHEWVSHPLIIRIRNNIAFHVDQKVIKSGLKRMGKMDEVTILKSNGAEWHQAYMMFGLEAFLKGIRYEDDIFKDLLNRAFEGHVRFTALIQDLSHDYFVNNGVHIERKYEEEEIEINETED